MVDEEAGPGADCSAGSCEFWVRFHAELENAGPEYLCSATQSNCTKEGNAFLIARHCLLKGCS